MNQIFQPFLRKSVLVFFDDILIYSPTLDTYVKHLKEALRRLQHHQLKLNLKRCVFGQLKLENLGHIISQEGVAADPMNVEAMWSWPVSKNAKALRGLLGLIEYYRRFVQWF